MDQGVLIETVWWDQDVIRYRITCSNGRFSGQTEVYENHDTLSRMADALNGFPSNTADLRDFELGTFDPSHALGGVRMHFYCVDSAGHIAVDVKLRGETSAGLGGIQSVALQIPLEAAAIDSFVGQIRKMNSPNGVRVHLLSA